MNSEGRERSYIGVRNGHCESFVGPDAIAYFRAETLASALRLYAKARIIPTRGVGPAKMLAMASAITGQSYRRGQYESAACDVKKWADEMKAALPKVEG